MTPGKVGRRFIAGLRDPPRQRLRVLVAQVERAPQLRAADHAHLVQGLARGADALLPAEVAQLEEQEPRAAPCIGRPGRRRSDAPRTYAFPFT